MRHMALDTVAASSSGRWSVATLTSFQSELGGKVDSPLARLSALQPCLANNQEWALKGWQWASSRKVQPRLAELIIHISTKIKTFRSAGARISKLASFDLVLEWKRRYPLISVGHDGEAEAGCCKVGESIKVASCLTIANTRPKESSMSKSKRTRIIILNVLDILLGSCCRDAKVYPWCCHGV